MRVTHLRRLDYFVCLQREQHLQMVLARARRFELFEVRCLALSINTGRALPIHQSSAGASARGYALKVDRASEFLRGLKSPPPVTMETSFFTTSASSKGL